jgi:hypothetical protein
MGGTSPEKIEEAKACAGNLGAWAKAHGNTAALMTAVASFEATILAAAAEIREKRAGEAGHAIP